jgi:hypothetical protein
LPRPQPPDDRFNFRQMLLDAQTLFPRSEIVCSGLNDRNFCRRRDDRIRAEKHSRGRIPVDPCVDDLNIKAVGSQHVSSWVGYASLSKPFAMYAAGAEGDDGDWFRRSGVIERRKAQKKCGHFG